MYYYISYDMDVHDWHVARVRVRADTIFDGPG